MPKDTIRLRNMRLDDWTAEALEAEATKMPPSYMKQADALRREAQILRGSRSTRVITVRERIVSEYMSGRQSPLAQV